MRMIEWIDPFPPTNEPEYHRVSEHAAIEFQKMVAAREGHVYATDEEALQDFIVVNWADVKEVE